MGWLAVQSNDKPELIFDRAISLRCPHCGLPSHLSAVSTPRYQILQRFEPKKIGVVYRCDSCEEPVTLRFGARYDFGNGRVFLTETYEEVERPQETFEHRYLPQAVADDFKEALTCFSNSCFNAFAAMCRRCVQSACSDLGADGKSKVEKQAKDLKEMAQIDDETFNVLKQIILGGHDGSHPNLPSVEADRAAILLELMKDVLHELYVRKGKLQEAMALRKKAIAAKGEEADGVA